MPAWIYQLEYANLVDLIMHSKYSHIAEREQRIPRRQNKYQKRNIWLHNNVYVIWTNKTEWYPNEWFGRLNPKQDKTITPFNLTSQTRKAQHARRECRPFLLAVLK